MKAKKMMVAMAIMDTHTPFHHEAAFSCSMQAIGIIRPDILIHVGDLGEMEGSSPWRKLKVKMPPLEYRLLWIDKDISDCNAMLDTIDAACKKYKVDRKCFIQGNHDRWMDNLVERYPYLAKVSHDYGSGYMFEDAMQFKSRGWEYIDNDDILKIGNLRFTHGNMYGRDNHTRNYLNKLGCNIMYGHYHECQQTSITHIDGEKSAWSIGCLKRLEKKYNKFMRGKPCSWSHGFAEITWFGDNFSVNVHKIIEGQVAVHGKLIDGNTQKT